MATTVSEMELLGEMRVVLDDVARKGLTSKQAYAKLLQAMFDSKGLIGTPPMLTSIISRYNEQFASDSKQRIPLGTASAVREAHALFLTQLGSMNKGRLPLDSLSPGLAQKVANLFDEIVGEIAAPIFEKAKTQFEAEFANATATYQTAANAWATERARHLDDMDALRDEFQQSQKDRDSAVERATTLLSQLDSLRRQLNACETAEAIARARLVDVEGSLRKVEDRVSELTLSEREERKVRLQLLDTSRQQALKIQSLENELKTSRESVKDKTTEIARLSAQWAESQTQLADLRRKSLDKDVMIESISKRPAIKKRLAKGLIGSRNKRSPKLV